MAVFGSSNIYQLLKRHTLSRRSWPWMAGNIYQLPKRDTHTLTPKFKIYNIIYYIILYILRYSSHIPPLPYLSNRYMLLSCSNKQKIDGVGWKHLIVKNQKNTKMLEKWGILLRFLRSLVVKTSKNAYLQTIMKKSYFKICYYHPPNRRLRMA